MHGLALVLAAGVAVVGGVSPDVVLLACFVVWYAGREEVGPGG